MTFNVQRMSQDSYDITKEELAKELETQANKLRSGELKSLSVMMIGRSQNDDLCLQQMWAGTNPYRHDPESGHFHSVELKGMSTEQFDGLHNYFLNAIELVVGEEEGFGFQGRTLGVGMISEDEPYVAIDVGPQDE